MDIEGTVVLTPDPVTARSAEHVGIKFTIESGLSAEKSPKTLGGNGGESDFRYT